MLNGRLDLPSRRNRRPGGVETQYDGRQEVYEETATANHTLSAHHSTGGEQAGHKVVPTVGGGPFQYKGVKFEHPGEEKFDQAFLHRSDFLQAGGAGGLIREVCCGLVQLVGAVEGTFSARGESDAP